MTLTGQSSAISFSRSFEGKLQTEVMLYFTEDVVDLDDDPLVWWRDNTQRYPRLAQLAKRYLCIPASSVPSERVFSAAGLLVSKLRASLSPTNIDAAIFLNKNKTLKSSRYQEPAEAPDQQTAKFEAQAIAEEEEDFVVDPEDVPMLPSLDSEADDEL